ncbi:MAG TPA: MEDS domain-containing protein [Methyloceanibacter sp.]|nr:MEDS domain-containing protein [Methyloceanibacter sp.]
MYFSARGIPGWRRAKGIAAWLRQARSPWPTVPSPACHVCALYAHPEEQYASLVPFVTEGLEDGERIVTIVDPNEREERRNRLRRAGMDVEAAERQGQLEISSWDEMYLAQGGFDPDAMLSLVQEIINKGRQLGYKRTRAWANMEWALQEVAGVERLPIYESRLNHILPLYGEAVV